MSQRSSSKFSTRSNFSESASSENKPYADTLANKLLHLHEENIQIGKQNQELSVRLHEVTTYNQALGLDIYKLDNQINDLEEKIESHREKTNKILHQTEVMNKKTESCKNLLNRNEQMSDLAKKFQTISHFKEKADKNVQELQKLFEDENYEKIASSFDAIAEKIHFLYWNNNELNEQITMLEKMVTERENEDRTQLKNSWEERRIDSQSISQSGKNDIKAGNKSESSPNSGAGIRAKMKKRIQKAKPGDNNNLKEEEGECANLQIQSDASKKNEYFMSSDSIENELQRKKKLNTPQRKNDNNNDPNQPEQFAVSSPDSKKSSIRKHRKGKKAPRLSKSKNPNTEITESENENEYNTNEYDDQNQNQIKFNAENMTPRKNLRYRKQPSPKSVNNENENEEENQINEYNSPHSKSSSTTTYSKSSSKSTHSDKSNQPQSPNSCTDTSSQLADSSNSNNSNKTENNDDLQHQSQSQNMSDGNVSLPSGRRLSRKKSNFPHKHLDQIKVSDSEYDYYESEPPPNPKKGTIRVSKNDSEYEYEYYDPDDANEEADDENEYDFVEENTAPPKVIISRPIDALDILENKKRKKNNPTVVTNYTECEYPLLAITKPEPAKFNSEDDETLINLHPKYADDDNINHNDKSEYIYVKKSKKTIKEEEERLRQREFVSVTIIPKKTKDELRQEKNDILDEEQIKKYEENALRHALEDEEDAEQQKIEKESKLKDEEEQFVKKCFKKLHALKQKKRVKMEKAKDEEIRLCQENRNCEKYYMNRITEIINMREQRELDKAIEEENENQIKTDIIQKAKIRIEHRKKEEEAIKEQEDIQKKQQKEAEEKLIEEKRLKARKFKEDEIAKLKKQENEENANKEREKQKRLELLKITHEKEIEKIENDRKKKEQENIENKERERLILEDMARRKKEKEDKEQQEKDIEKAKHQKEVNILKSKILKFRQLKEKEKNEKEEEKNNEKEVEFIKQKLREKRRKERELREKERIERERKDRELRELYEGIFDVPVKRIFDKDDKNNNNENDDDNYIKNSRLGNDRDGFLSDSAEMSTSDSMAELDVAAPISLEEEKLANLHDKNSKHTHSNCKRIKVKKNKSGSGQESEYEYEYEYEYECEDDDSNNDDNQKLSSGSNSKSRSKSRSKLNTKSSLSNFSESESESIVMKSKNNNNKQIDEEEAEQIAFQEQQRLQQLLKQMDNQNNKERGKSKRSKRKSSLDSSKFESDSSIIDVSQQSPKGDTDNHNNDSILNYKYTVENDYNSHSESSDVIQYSDDDYFPRPKDIIKTHSKKDKNDDDEYEYEYDESNPDPTKRRRRKNKNGTNSEDSNNNNNNNNNNLIINKNRPLRKKKAEKPEFVPEYYNPKQQPKFKPIVVGIVSTNDKNSTKNTINDPSKMGTIVNEIENPEKPKPILIENCKIKHPVPIKMDTKNFELIKTPEQLQKEAEEKAAREERERLHAERAKKFRHAIDANGKEYEYDYEYDYEYETENQEETKENETEKIESDQENKDSTDTKTKSKTKTKNDQHASYRDSTEILNELSKEVANADAVIKQTTEVIKHKEEEEMNELRKSKLSAKSNTINGEEEDETDKNKDKTKIKRVRTGRKIKKSPTNKTDGQPNTNTTSNDNNDNAGIRKQKSVTFVNDPANVIDNNNENQVNFNPSQFNGIKTPSKRMINSARRQRNSPSSPIIDPTLSPNSKQRLSNRRNFSDNSNNNNEEEEAFFDDVYEDEDEQIPKPTNNLLVEIDSRPDTPRKPPQQQQQSNPSTPNSIENNDDGEIVQPSVPAIDLSQIQNFVDSEYEYEYEYEYNDDENVNKVDITRNGSSSSNNNLLLKKDKSDEDFTENEKAFDSRSNSKLQRLIRQVRADAASLSNEDLQNILSKIKAEIEIQQKSNTELEEKLEELEKIRDRKVPKNLSNFSTQILQFEPIIYENKFQSIEIQTEVAGEFIKNIEATLHKQNKEKQEMIAVQKRIEAAQQQVISIDNQIKEGEKLTIEKKQSIENLKAEIIKVKEEIAHLNYDTTQDDVQAKQCEIEIEKLDNQVHQHQQKLEKVSHTIQELQIKLQEMINYRSVLEAELNDMYNREKPEVRKLIEDVRNTKQSSEEAQTKFNQLQKKIVTRRDELAKIKNSQDKKKSDDLRLIKEKLSRRLNKWTILSANDNLDLNNLKEFSVANHAKREKIKNETYNVMRKTWLKDESVNSLTKYADLLENILTEYTKQNSVT